MMQKDLPVFLVSRGQYRPRAGGTVEIPGSTQLDVPVEDICIVSNARGPGDGWPAEREIQPVIHHKDVQDPTPRSTTAVSTNVGVSRYRSRITLSNITAHPAGWDPSS